MVVNFCLLRRVPLGPLHRKHSPKYSFNFFAVEIAWLLCWGLAGVGIFDGKGDCLNSRQYGWLILFKLRVKTEQGQRYMLIVDALAG